LFSILLCRSIDDRLGLSAGTSLQSSHLDGHPVMKLCEWMYVSVRCWHKV
uniref:Uncharacterized protein n=1 Tax=Anopheles quadriannulatus TaxID=34691 RepID=A0A182XR62_ANOQN